MSQWVQHISGQGEKWEVEIGRCVDCWHHHHKASGKTFFLPKSEYVLCDSPERWVDVSAECVFSEEGALVHYGKTELEFGIFPTAKGYRLRKVQIKYVCEPDRWAFIVEKKEDADAKPRTD